MNGKLHKPLPVYDDDRAADADEKEHQPYSVKILWDTKQTREEHGRTEENQDTRHTPIQP